MGRGSIAAPVPAQAGIGLRLPHHALVLAERPAAAWLEVHPENYMSDQHSLGELELIRADYPLSLHAVGLSLGSAHGVDAAHIGRLRQLAEVLEPGLVSDHLSWSVAGGHYLPDLLPLPYTEEALRVLSRNVGQVQEALGRQILVENPSTYLSYAASVIPEAEFLAELARRSGCGVLFDVNNVYVSASNQRLEPAAVLEGWRRALDPRTVAEIHLAGHALTRTDAGEELRIDDHGDRVCAAVWTLYERALAWLGPRPTLLEWDTRLPAFAVLQAECALAQAHLEAAPTRDTDAAPARCHARAV
ncbi:MAG: DUF692 domain-containing protein [Gammaproteobacteria bacterium]|nr:DUF692 domain-containing protein [Gammaproteobacteria bacterium]